MFRGRALGAQPCAAAPGGGLAGRHRLPGHLRLPQRPACGRCSAIVRVGRCLRSELLYSRIATQSHAERVHMHASGRLRRVTTPNGNVVLISHCHGGGHRLEWTPTDFKRASSRFGSALPGSELIIGPWGHGGLTNYRPQKQSKDGGRSAFPQALHTIAFFDRACGYHPSGRCCLAGLMRATLSSCCYERCKTHTCSLKTERSVAIRRIRVYSAMKRSAGEAVSHMAVTCKR